jgi:hypothetical protein
MSALFKGIIWRRWRRGFSANFDFALSNRLPSGFTYTRTPSDPVFQWSGGVYSLVGPNVAVFEDLDYLGFTGLRGWRCEGARTNLVTYSADLTQAAWTKSNATIGSNALATLDGTSEADKIIEDNTTNQHSVAFAAICASGDLVCYSQFLKAGERTQVALSLDVTGTPIVAKFDLSAGEITAADAGFWWVDMYPFGNGWYRCILSVVATQTSVTAKTHLLDASGNISYAGNNTSGAYAWMAQIEARNGYWHAACTSPIPTNGSTGFRGGDSAVRTGSFPAAYTVACEALFNRTGVDNGPMFFQHFNSATIGDALNFVDAFIINAVDWWGASPPIVEGQVAWDMADASTVGINSEYIPTDGTPLEGHRGKVAIRVQAGSHAMACRGSLATSSFAGVPTGMNTETLGSGNGSGLVEGHVISYSRRTTPLIDADLIALAGATIAGGLAFPPAGPLFPVDSNGANVVDSNGAYITASLT